MDEKLIYLTLSEIARELGHRANSFPSLTKHWENDPDNPCPTPDAYSTAKDGYLNKLWLPDRLAEWHAWDHQRIALSRRRQRAGGRKSKPRNPYSRPV